MLFHRVAALIRGVLHAVVNRFYNANLNRGRRERKVVSSTENKRK